MPEYGIHYMSSNNVIYSCKYNVVWCPKYRRPVLTEPVAACLKDVIQNTCNKFEREMINVEIMPDHIYLLVEVYPQFGIHRLVKNIKGLSSRILRDEFRRLRSRLSTLWSNSYFVSTVGGAPLEIVKQYIEQQKYS